MVIQPAKSPVTPRVYSPDSNEQIPLVDKIVQYLDSGFKVIAIKGVGKSIALSHLAAELDESHSRLNILERPTRSNLKTNEMTVCGFTRKSKADIVLELCPWTMDDVIEYLLSKHPQECKSVMNRVDFADDDLLVEGNPYVWSTTLDEMAERPECETVQQSILDHVDNLLADETELSTIANICISSVFDDRNLEQYVSKIHSHVDDEKQKFFACAGVRLTIAIRRLQELLESAIAAPLSARKKLKIIQLFEKQWSPEILERVASRFVRDLEAIDFLVETIHQSGFFRGSGTAASLLARIKPDWHPNQLKKRILDHADLPNVNWQNVRLQKASLKMVNFTAADLKLANFSKANIVNSYFATANLERVKMNKTFVIGTDFSHANLANVKANEATFQLSNLSNVNLNNAILSNSGFRNVDLTNSNLSNANLQNCKFEHSVFDGANLEYARLDEASLALLDCRTVNLDHASCIATLFPGTGFERLDFNGTRFDWAYFYNATLTATTMRNCSLNYCNLTAAKLADIDWEGCNLQFADFTSCNFHMGSTRCGLVDSPYPSHGTRTGFYTDEYDEQYFKRPEEIRKANLRGCNLISAKVFDADFYLVDLRDALYTDAQRQHFQKCRAILSE